MPEPIVVLIVDDERPARRKLRRLLEAADGIERVYEAPAARLALEVMEDAAPDVVFLDVRMPGMDGFQFLEALNARHETEIIFVTAYDEHAVRAFDVQAVDYLLKPYDEARFRIALERARAAVAAKRAAAGAAGTSDASGAGGAAVGNSGKAGGGGGVERLLVEAASGRKVPLATSRIARIKAQRNDAVFVTDDGARYRLRTTLSELVARLDARRFWRISRSEIVNLDYVAEIDVLGHGDARIHMADGGVRRMSRRYRDGLARFGLRTEDA